jgi:hypothetical protein
MLVEWKGVMVADGRDFRPDPYRFAAATVKW